MSTPDTKVPHPTDDELVEAMKPDQPECVMHNGLSGEADMTATQKNILEGRVCSLEEKLAISNQKRSRLEAQLDAAENLISYKERERVKVELELGELTRAYDSLKGVYTALQQTNRMNITIKEAHASTICMFASKGKRS